MIAANTLEPDVRGAKALNREAQERWDDDGGANPQSLAIQTGESGCAMIDCLNTKLARIQPIR